jgi:RNA polymerase sigma-70 factor (ECF subfamily)
MTDEELVVAFQAGDVGCFDELTLRWERQIRGAAHRVLGSAEEARDVSQEAFLKAYRALPGFKREAKFSSWLYQIGLNLCRDRLRRRKVRSFVSIDALEEHAALPSRTATAYDDVVRGDLARLVAAAVAELPDEEREVVILKEYQELTFVEIADILGVPTSTVKTRLYRALGVLRVRLLERGVRGAIAAAPLSKAAES